MSPGLENAGVLLINSGTPAAPTAEAVRPYLRELLDNPRVMRMPTPLRKLLVHGLIAPFRAGKAAQAYARIWTEEGSPLLVHSERALAGLRKRLPGTPIALGMLCGKPSVAEGISALVDDGARHIIAAPLYPQYAEATVGTALALVNTEIAGHPARPALVVLPPFYDAPGFIEAWCAHTRPLLASFEPDHALLSFHGLPERHIREADPTGNTCLVKTGCCDQIGRHNRRCYRAHCFATARGVTHGLALTPDNHSVSFQSRLGPGAWLGPATRDRLAELPPKGVRRLAVLCPSFVVDNLETLEEIGMQGKETFLEAGGEAFLLVPSLNDNPVWLDGLATMLRDVGTEA